MKVLLPLLALVTLAAVAFVLVELRAPLTPSTAPPPAAPPTTAPQPMPPPVAPPVATPTPVVPPTAGSPLPHASPPPSDDPPPPTDPLDVVVRGRTRRDWHTYYADRQRQMTVDIQRYQSVIDRAVAGEEPDPRELGEAHEKVRELNTRLKEDLEALQQIDATP